MSNRRVEHFDPDQPKDGTRDTETPPVAEDLDEAAGYPWFVGSDGQGRARLAANIAAAASVPVLAVA